MVKAAGGRVAGRYDRSGIWEASLGTRHRAVRYPSAAADRISQLAVGVDVQFDVKPKITKDSSRFSTRIGRCRLDSVQDTCENMLILDA
jgi:hypothetical protein